MRFTSSLTNRTRQFSTLENDNDCVPPNLDSDVHLCRNKAIQMSNDKLGTSCPFLQPLLQGLTWPTLAYVF